MRALPLLTLLTAAAALDDLGSCQSRCYDMAADLVGCDTDDYACHCAAFDTRLAPQMSSCMIEGCAFGDKGPTMGTAELKDKVCGMAGQSPAPEDPPEETPGDATSAATPSMSASSQDPGETAEPSQGPDETADPGPEPTNDGGDGDSDGDGGDDESGAGVLSAWPAALLPALGYLLL